jgi:outer membrane cobalamin receptor
VTGYDIPEISVTDSLMRTKEKSLVIRRKTVLELQPEDAGELLQKLAGVNVRSYGGLGGLKTISVRGLGSQHTSIVVDGFTVMNNQTGQVNLGQIQSDNIERMYLITGSQRNVLVPASAQVMGSAVCIETFESTFPKNKHSLRFGSRIGSYDQFDNYLSYKLGNEKMFVSVSGKFRFADGRYPYIVQNGDTVYNGIRNNNHYEDLFAGLQAGFRIGKKGILSIGMKAYSSDQELPGAVILYSDNAFQTLRSDEQKAQAAYTFNGNKWSVRGFASAALSGIRYRDTTFLNTAGMIDSQFDQTAVQCGLSTQYRIKENLTLFGATEQQISSLETDQAGFGKPKRNQNISLMGGKYQFGKAGITGQLSSQIIDEVNETLQRDRILRVNPFVQLDLQPVVKGKEIEVYLNYRNSFRMPSFNELYYNNIGNTQLKPEDAHQFSIGTILPVTSRKANSIIRIAGFYNIVENKIVAVPTKNLFIWSIHNIGAVHITGAEASIEWLMKFKKNWSTGVNANYTFQSALDHTSPTSPTYLDQIAYVPKHTGNLDLSIYYRKTGIRLSSLANSIRYSLNENVPANEVPGFMILDAAVFSTISVKDHDLRVQFTCKNVANSYYSIIRYYVMPGRMFLLTFNYALH